MTTPVCEHCSLPFTPARQSAKQRAAGHVQRFCSNACRAASSRRYATEKEAKRACYVRARQRRGLAVLSISPAPDGANCRVCGVAFKPVSVTNRICSDDCRAQSNREQARLASIAKDARDRAPRPCRFCGETFVPEYGNKRKLFCSAPCLRRHLRKAAGKNHVDRARKAGVEYEPVNPFKVFERDGWRCQICLHKTPRRLRGTTSDRAPELDHRVPFAQGGSHTWSNVQCACRRCNQAKGGTQVIGQMALFPRA